MNSSPAWDYTETTGTNLQEMLLQALKTVENALEIYDHSLTASLGSQPNIHGRGLAYFQKGYILHKFASELTLEQFQDKTRAQILQQAHDSFSAGIDYFKSLNHLCGIYLSVSHKLTCLQEIGTASVEELCKLEEQSV